MTRVLVRTDDEVYRVDSVWLGPPRATFPWRARYVSYGLGLLVMIVVMFLQRRIGIGLDFFSVAWALIITVLVTRFLGQRMMKEGGRDQEGRLRYGFRVALGRPPSEAEQQILRGNLRFHLDYFAGKEKEIDAFLSQGDSRPDASLDRRELAAYASVASVLLNMDEMVTKQ